MLVCSCNYITDKEIRDVITEMLDQDCWQLIVPAKVYHAMEKRGRCCGCFPNVVDIIVTTTEAYHAARASEEDKVVDFIDRLKKFQQEQKQELIERRNRLARTA
ncbi:(2Fe-2S)-binding protein [Allorhizobium sp. BGMRC 0089]|uniref:(2Fe-2S)-binding protein n=1 Tax=Allorhizobium sonneratiae TaxID=2934936 RepID=UPI0020337DED|nr:(2Fe-2S)-binding protein [Allorhizobium sonneratiae]MCM2294341.1 (2Fe-2S)-binding protein [Allorhizobium sonneratiae]